jgi:hypothetical protein
MRLKVKEGGKNLKKWSLRQNVKERGKQDAGNVKIGVVDVFIILKAFIK